MEVKPHELEIIERNYPANTVRCKHEMLIKWLENAKLPTWNAIADALCGMGEHGVAFKIRKKYCSSSTATGTCLFAENLTSLASACCNVYVAR